MSEFCMPSLGSDMEAGTLVEWLVKPGDRVQRGDLVAVVETQKGAIEIETFESGVVRQLLVPVGQEVPVGTALALLAAEGEGATPMVEPAPVEPASVAEASVAESASEPVAVLAQTPVMEPVPPALPVTETTRLRISPLARKQAQERGLSLTALTDWPGTGPQGALTAQDVMRYLEQVPSSVTPTDAPHAGPAARQKALELGVSLAGRSGTGPHGLITPGDVAELAAPATSEAKPNPMRAAIAAAMSRAKREIPHYYLGHTLDLEPALTWMESFNAERPISERLVYAVLLVKAVALALRKFPEFNGFCPEGVFQPVEDIDVGVAISLRTGGLVAPALHQVDQKDLVTLMAEFRDLVNRARAGQLRSSEMKGGSITITNLGEQGVETVFPVIYPPQVAMIGFGTVLERPWVVAGEILPRRVITVSLAGDHRVSDGHRGAMFLARVEKLLRKPEKL